MSEPHRLWTTLGAIFFVALGFVFGAGASAWVTRDQRAEPWRKMRVEHEGTEGAATRTRVVFENPKLPLQAIEVLRSPDGKPELAHIALRDGKELTAEYEDGRPSMLQGPDGSKALFSFKGSKARVAFFDRKGEAAGDKVVQVPVELHGALKLAGRTLPKNQRYASWSLIGEAWAQDAPAKEDKKEDPQISVERQIELSLDISVPKGKDDGSGKAQVEASCEPFTCFPVTKEVKMPGKATVRISVAGSKKKSELDEPGSGSIEPFKKDAQEERKVAERVIPDVSAAMAAVSVTALACKSLKLNWTLCVNALSKGSTAGAAIHSVSSHEVQQLGREVDKRAEALFYEEKARAALDDKATIEVCVSRDGYARVCTKISGHPLGAKAMPRAEASVNMRRGIGGTLVGSFVMTQSDGAGCKFSPSPRTDGPVKMSFDNDKGVLTAILTAEGKGTRSNLSCNMGSANMRWTTSYSTTVTQSFTPEQLQSGGKLALKMQGTMKGTGSYSFSNCRSTSGVSGNCPAGKREPYAYPLELNGELDLDTRTGSGRLVVSRAPLGTRGTWQIPAAGGAK